MQIGIEKYVCYSRCFVISEFVISNVYYTQIEQLQEAGEEVAILAVDLDYDQCTHFGSPTGEWFMSEQRSLTKSFLNFCKTKNSSKSGGKNVTLL